MTIAKWLRKKTKSFEGRVAYETERLLLALNRQFVSRMVRGRVRRSELARRLDKDRSFITRILNGNPNLTIKTLVSVATALDSKIRVELEESEFAGAFSELITPGSARAIATTSVIGYSASPNVVPMRKKKQQSLTTSFTERETERVGTLAS